MERTQLFDLMGELKLYGMKAAFDEIMATARPNVSMNLSVLSAICSTRRSSEKQARLDRSTKLHHRQAAARQRPRRLRVRGHADQCDTRT